MIGIHGGLQASKDLERSPLYSGPRTISTAPAIGNTSAASGGTLAVSGLSRLAPERATFRDFFALVAVKVWVQECHQTESGENGPRCQDKALHRAVTNLDSARDCEFLDTPLRLVGEGELETSSAEGERNYERLAAEAAVAAVAAAAFLAAFAAVEALRRRLVFGGVAGASPISSATMMLVTNNLGP
jgi:hypothetical protein